MIKYKISIIVPVYNVEQYVEKCIESILSQTYKNFELILVNDGSTDKSLDIILKYKNNPNIRIINKKNSGQSDSRFQGLLQAKGEYIYYVDSDDFIESYALEMLVEQINKTKADIVFGRYRLINEYGNVLREQKPYKEKVLEDTEKILRDAICALNFKTSLWIKIIKRKLLTDSYIDEIRNVHFNEDLLLSIILAYHCKKVVFINDIIYNVLQRKNSLTRNLKPELIMSNEKIFNIIRLFLEDKGLWESCSKDFYNGYVKTITYTMSIVALKSKSLSEFYSYYNLFNKSSLFHSYELKRQKKVLYTLNRFLYDLIIYNDKLFYLTIKTFKKFLKY